MKEFNLFSWSDIETLIHNPAAAEVKSPLSQYRPHTSHTVVEVNDFTSDENLFLDGASGDGFGCYKGYCFTETAQNIRIT
jgi:predicted Zn-dependent protease with MMP-like domain